MYFEDAFFENEVRCGFEVPRMMKRAWAAQMEVLKIVIDICDRHGLMYFADWGTLLGAVRHKGYVPWDDDIDICMKRKDYNQLIQILPKELPEGIKVVGIHAPEEKFYLMRTDITSLIVCALRELWSTSEYMRFFHGYPFKAIALDIFPLDVVPRDEKTRQVHKKLLSVGSNIASYWYVLKEEGTLYEKLEQFEKFSGMPLPKNVSEDQLRNCLWKSLDRIAEMFGEEEGEQLTEYIFSYKNPQLIVDKDCYQEVVMMPFENMEIAVPVGYDTILTAKYGNYREPVRYQAGHNYPFYREHVKAMEKDLQEAGINLSIDELCDRVVSGEINLKWT